MAPRILSVERALPRHFVEQEKLLAAFRALWGQQHFNLQRLEQLHRAVRVGGRHLALPLEEYAALQGFAARNSAWTRVAAELGAEAVRKALLAADVAPAQVDHLFFVTVTGIATPSIDARMVEPLGLRADVKRSPLFGLGCVAGAAGLARVSDVLRSARGEVAVLLSVELCSLTLQREDLSIPNIIASGLFGDGAAAAVLDGGARERGPRILATRSVFYPGTERVMGWDVVDSGFKVVLSPGVPQLVRERLRGDVDRFLGDQGLRRSDIAHFLCHTGGPKVLEAFEEALELPRSALQRSWDSLQQVGNLSSASVLFVLSDLLASGEPRAGDRGLLLAMGPGFCSELVLLQW
ncbi:MAG TPA: 3-oxoacyl-[acyl-carrier-protein] synthase III C-terminal domain-containing protein [Myxococcales bacterium]|nr:3-oxoacyl-[acyl-carrier-protein] synthase III C-terminal domain-containing protein [Myxococcales bacterium]